MKEIVSRDPVCILDAFLIHQFFLWNTVFEHRRTIYILITVFRREKRWIKNASRMHMGPRETVSFTNFTVKSLLPEYPRVKQVHQIPFIKNPINVYRTKYQLVFFRSWLPCQSCPHTVWIRWITWTWTFIVISEQFWKLENLSKRFTIQIKLYLVSWSRKHPKRFGQNWTRLLPHKEPVRPWLPVRHPNSSYDKCHSAAHYTTTRIITTPVTISSTYLPTSCLDTIS